MIAIAGCMRNGTSLTAQLLSKTVLNLGPENEIFGATDNDKEGIWESKTVVQLNSELLNARGATLTNINGIRRVLETDWDADDGWIKVPYDFFSKKGAKFIKFLHRYNFYTDNKPDVGFKDPRLSLLLSHWKMAYDSIEKHEVKGEKKPFKVVWCIRKPEESAESMARLGYDGVKDYDHYLKLWELYNQSILDSLSQSDAEYCIMDYNSTLSDPESHLKRLFEFVDPDYSGESFDEAMYLVNARLYRHKTNLESNNVLYQEIKSML